MNLTAISTYDTLISIWVTTIGDIAQYKPLSVRTPLIVELTALAIPLAAVSNLSHLLGLQINHLQLDTILDKRQFLAIRAVLRTASFNLREVYLPFKFQRRQFWEYTLFLYQSSVGEVQVIIPHDAGSVELPVAVTL